MRSDHFIWRCKPQSAPVAKSRYRFRMGFASIGTGLNFSILFARASIFFSPTSSKSNRSIKLNSFELAAESARNDIKLAVLTRSSKGSIILEEGRTVSISAEPISSVVDTTGAGDLYAAGFLFGYSQGMSLEVSGRLASLAASEIISHIGARPAVPLQQFARDRGIIS